MKQLGLALHGYHTANNVFPPGSISLGWNLGWWGTTISDGDPLIHNLNGMALLLPYMDLQSLYDRFNPKVACNQFSNNSSITAVAGGSAALNGPFLSQQVETFSCPSDNGYPLLGDSGAGGWPGYCISPGSGYAGVKTNYDFSSGVIDVCCSDNSYQNTSSPEFWGSGTELYGHRMFGENSNCTIAKITDGTSNTVAMSERTYNVADGSCPAWGFRGWVMITDIAWPNDIDGGSGPGDYGSNLNDWRIPSSWSSWTSAKTTPGTLADWFYTGSLHPGGCNMLFGDGAVRFINQTTKFNVLLAFATIDLGELVDLPPQ
jgi:prepilin-type processing-associated H-X9-DG protein